MGNPAWQASYPGQTAPRRDAEQGFPFGIRLGSFWGFWGRKMGPILRPDSGHQNGTALEAFHKKTNRKWNKRSYFGARNLGAKWVPFSGPKIHETRPKQCGSGTAVVQPQYLLERHCFASIWTRPLCTCVKGERNSCLPEVKGISPLVINASFRNLSQKQAISSLVCCIFDSKDFNSHFRFFIPPPPRHSRSLHFVPQIWSHLLGTKLGPGKREVNMLSPMHLLCRLAG